MKLSATIFILALVSYSNFIIERTKADRSLLCPPCIGTDCDSSPESCPYGITRNYCGQIDCIKGPGARCGGKFDLKGKCAKGLRCRCDVCLGCSQETLECHYKHCKDSDHNDELTRADTYAKAFLF